MDRVEVAPPGAMTCDVTVVVVGSLNVDLVARVAALPGPGETVVGPGIASHGGGKSANAAVAAARLGARVSLVAAVRDDPFGSEALDELIGERSTSASTSAAWTSSRDIRRAQRSSS